MILLAVLGLVAGSLVWIVGEGLADDCGRICLPTCAACETPLPARAWLPLTTLVGGARCPACGLRQPSSRALCEVLAAAYFALAYWRFGYSTELVAVLACSLPLLIVLMIDLWTRYVYTSVVIAGALIGFGFALANGFGTLLTAALAALGGGLIFAVVFVLARTLYGTAEEDPFGWGDVLLAAMIGAITNYPGVVRALVLGIFLGGAVAAVLLARRKRGGDAFAYGACLCGGALLALVLPG